MLSSQSRPGVHSRLLNTKVVIWGLQVCFLCCQTTCAEEKADCVLTKKKSEAAVFLTIVSRASTITAPTQNSCLKEKEEDLLWQLEKIRIKK